MIYFFGDTHGCFDHVIDVVGQDRPTAVVFLGDLQAQRPLEIELATILDKTEVWFIHGNHDTDSEADYDNLFGSALADRNLHGRVVEIDGLRIAGLGGIFRGQVWAPPAEWLHERPDPSARARHSTAIIMTGWTTAATASALGSMPSASASVASATPTVAWCGRATSTRRGRIVRLRRYVSAYCVDTHTRQPQVAQPSEVW